MFAKMPESDDLDAIIDGSTGVQRTASNGYTAPTYDEPCKKCRGTGRFVGYSGRAIGPCFECKGSGKHTFKTAPEKRAQARASADRSKQRAAAENMEAFRASHPDIFAWFDGNDFPFAVAMREAVTKYGHLTERQEAAARGAMEKRAAAQREKAERIADVKPVNMGAIEEAFAQANKSLKRPKLNFADFTLSVAPATSRNAGALYVKAGGLYLGKIDGGNFTRSRDCSPELAAKVLEVAADPKGAAIAYGRLTGSCSACRRALTDPASVAAGIGPICARNFGF